jgi:quercetin dioxygenase-like cupin family protein
MEVKYNEATNNRPEGDRVIDAPAVFTDLEKFYNQLIGEEAWEKNDRNGITLCKTERHTQVLTLLKKGATIPDNIVDGWVSIHVIKGDLRIQYGEEDMVMTEQQLVNFHPGIKHSVEATSIVLLLITAIK